MSKVSIVTLGCKQNKYESDCMARILFDNGYDVNDGLCPADIYIINTCAVTAEGEKKSRQYIEKCNKLNNNCKIIVCGCASQNNIEQFRSKKNVFSVFGTEMKQNILDYINNSKFEVAEINKNYCSPEMPIKTTTREYLKIQDGCNNFCSYCLIPYLRGRSRSRNIDDIVREAQLLATRSREIILTGIDISSYSIDGKPALPILMERLSNIDSLISLGSLEINVITQELLIVLSKMPNFSPHFHLSLQSGDDNILKKMNRHYTTNQYYEKIELIRKFFPLANITTDVIVGFAMESEEEFNNTAKFIKKCGFSFVHIFPYSKRVGTLACKMYNDLDKSIKKDRVDKLEEINKQLQIGYLSNFIGKKSTMLVEEKKQLFEGFSFEYIRCYCDEKLIEGNIYNIEFESIFEDGMKVKII